MRYTPGDFPFVHTNLTRRIDPRHLGASESSRLSLSGSSMFYVTTAFPVFDFLLYLVLFGTKLVRYYLPDLVKDFLCFGFSADFRTFRIIFGYLG